MKSNYILLAMSLSFEEEIVALTVAIFIAFYRQENENDKLSMTAGEVSNYLSQYLLQVGWVSLSASQGNLDFHVDPTALHHGFQMFSKILKKEYIGELDKSKIKMDDFFKKPGGAQSFSIWVKRDNAAIGLCRTYQPSLPGHRNVVLETIQRIRDHLLSSIMPVKLSRVKSLSEIFQIREDGSWVDVRGIQAGTSAEEAFNSVPSLRSPDTFNTLSTKHQRRITVSVVDGVKKVLMTTKNYSEADADLAVGCKLFASLITIVIDQVLISIIYGTF